MKLTVFALTLLPQTTIAAPPPPQSPVAIVVGNDLGLSHEPPLRFASRDAQRVARTLRELAGVERADLHLLLNRPLEEIQRELQVVLKTLAVQPDSRLIFFFSGHAGEDGLHVDGEILRWQELAALWQHVPRTVRVAFLDTCHAGTATQAKGFSVTAAELAPATGIAILAASGSTEAAHEAENLGGSFFSHYLVSGMRGAADTDSDFRVSVSELQTYVSRSTRQATAQWAPSVQNPEYRFDLQGAQDLVLTDLTRSDSSLTFDDAIAGQLLVVSRSTGAIVTDMNKTFGTDTLVAIPPDRYLILLRREGEVYAGEIELGWGGQRSISTGDLEVQNPLVVARKGTRVIVRPHRITAGVAVSSPPLLGAEWGLGPMIGYHYLIEQWEIGLQADASHTRVQTADVVVEMWRAGLYLELAHAWFWALGDLRLSVVGGAQLWRQHWQQVKRLVLVPVGTFGISFRMSIHGPFFAEPVIAVQLLWPRMESAGYRTHASFSGGLRLGKAF